MGTTLASERYGHEVADFRGVLGRIVGSAVCLNPPRNWRAVSVARARNSGTIGTGEPMTVAVNAIYENGVLKPEGPLALKEQAKVRVIIQSDEEEPPAVGDDDPTGWKVAREFIGCISDAPEDVAEHHDKYLYGRE